MDTRLSARSKSLCIVILFVFLIGCSLFNLTEEAATETPLIEEPVTITPTPTTMPGSSGPTPSAEDSRCKDLAGEIEIFVLVGPAEAVGMEPFAVGSAPFRTTGQEPPYPVEGGGQIQYDEILTEEWGTYEVTLVMDTIISGECAGETGNETLSLQLEAEGEQNVIVDAGSFHGEYPWSGSHTFDLVFPLEEGASVEGEGYNFVLHLDE